MSAPTRDQAAGLILLRFGRIGAARSRWPESPMFAQPDLEELLPGAPPNSAPSRSAAPSR